MKVDVRIAGNTYNGVPAVILPLATEGTARFCEVSDTTAKAEDVLQGKTFYNAAGELTMGTAVIQSDDVWSVIVNQTDHQTISYSCSAYLKSDEADKYKLGGLDVTPAVTADAGYTAGETSVESDEENKTITISATPAIKKSLNVTFKGIYGLTLGIKVTTDDYGNIGSIIEGYDKNSGVGMLNKNLLNSDELVLAGINDLGQEYFVFAGGKVFGDSVYIGIVQPDGSNFKTAKFDFANNYYASGDLVAQWNQLFDTLSQASAEVYVLVSESEFTAEQALAAIAAHN